MNYTIYSVENNTNGKKYVGATIDYERRCRQHKRYGKRGFIIRNSKKRTIELYGDMKRLGIEQFYFRILEIVDDKKKAGRLEQYYIKKYNSIYPFGYNLTSGGDRLVKGVKKSDETKAKIGKAHKGKKVSDETKARIGKASLGRKHSDETRARMSKAHKGEKNHMFGKKQSQETIEKNRKAQLGKKLSEETKARMSKAHKGKPKSEEHKQNIRKARLGKKLSEETKAKLSKAMLGKKRKPFSEETKAKMSAANKGENNPMSAKNRLKRQRQKEQNKLLRSIL